MIARYPALCIVFIIIFYSITFSAVAQPSLPDIEGKADSDQVTLRWTSPYNNIKSIAVQRSHDSITYATIGNLYKVNKGTETYTDAHAAGGSNYYRLVLTFSSGLNWTTNHCKVYTNMPYDDKAAGAKTLQGNNGKEASGSNGAKQGGNASYPPNGQAGTGGVSSAAATWPQLLDANRKRYVLRTDDTVSEDESMLVLSEYISIDAYTGNINIVLPADLGRRHYSVKFYNDKGELLYDIPHITNSKIIMDKRNFQQKGVYKFVIRRDILEFESGYLRVSPN